MDVRKEAGVGAGWSVDEGELALIHAQSKRALGAEEVYAFTVRLCDNEIDRDWERFSPAALEAMAERFVGKSGVFDHDWSARGQTARIYKTEVVQEEGTVTGAGDGYAWLKGYAYMLRTEGNKELIAEIEGGIKREVSVGVAVSGVVCSVCGGALGDGDCRHVKGRTYNGTLCWGELREVTDVYEWSFVAVPAQRRAGVVKAFQSEDREARKQLEQEAALGRRYLSALRREVGRLGALAEPEMDAAVRERMVEKLDEAELVELRKSYERRTAERLPLGVQICYGERGEADVRQDGAFLI